MIPYNPSSFDTNKTLLENILELKKWLQAHPSYEVFYSSASGDTSQQQTYNTSTITDPTNLAVGDVVVFANTTLGNVIAVDSDLGTFTCDPAISFKGPQGIQGPTGPTGADGQDGQDGADGVSITNVVVNASNHLICTLSDGNTIDAGAINFSEEYVQITSTSGTLSSDDRQKISRGATLTYVNGTISYYLEPYLYDSSANTIYYSNVRIESNLNYGGKVRAMINTSIGSYSLTLVSTNGKVVLSENIDSQTSTNGQVLTSNGSGSASWQSIPAQTPEGTAIKSTGDTSGKVLTADGSGGASWQTAGGGGSGKYLHCIQFRDSANNDTRIYANIITDDSAPYTTATLSTLANAMYTLYSGGFISAKKEVKMR